MDEKVDLEMEMDYEPEIEYILDEPGGEETVVEETAEVEKVEKAPAVDPKVKALEEQLAALQGSILGQPKNSTQELVEALRVLQGEKESKVPEIDFEPYKKQFFIDPVSNTKKIAELANKDVKDLALSQQKQIDLMMQKMSILTNDSTRGFYSKYADEVESFVAKGEDYSKAIKLVKADHMEDLVKDAVAEALEQLKGTETKPQLQMTNSNFPPTPRQGVKQVKLTPKQVKVIEGFTKDGMLDFADAAEYCRDHGLI